MLLLPIKANANSYSGYCEFYFSPNTVQTNVTTTIDLFITSRLTADPIDKVIFDMGGNSNFKFLDGYSLGWTVDKTQLPRQLIFSSGNIPQDGKHKFTASIQTPVLPNSQTINADTGHGTFLQGCRSDPAGSQTITAVNPTATQPNPPTITGTNEATGRPRLDWPAVSNANRYEIYRDRTYVGQTTTLGYTDDPQDITVHDYHVLAVNGTTNEKSYQSNTVTLRHYTAPPASGGLTHQNVIQVASLGTTLLLSYIIIRQFRWRT
jgi:hypothetical protein